MHTLGFLFLWIGLQAFEVEILQLVRVCHFQLPHPRGDALGEHGACSELSALAKYTARKATALISVASEMASAFHHIK